MKRSTVHGPRSTVPDSAEARFAIHAVREAASLVREIQRTLVTPALTKSDRSPVTVADYAAQALVGSLLADAFPHDPLVGEEDAAGLRDEANRATLEQVTAFTRSRVPSATCKSVCAWIDRGSSVPGGRFWTLDPVDGTKGFLRGEQYAVALALVIDGQVRLGVLGCPNLARDGRQALSGAGCIACAAAGQGAWSSELNGKGFERLAVSACASLDSARILRSVESGHTNVDQMGDLVARLGCQADPVLMDSQAKYAVLAAGEGELLFRLISASRPDYREMIWDQAAGSIVVQEAGGRVSDLDGKPLDFTRGRTLAANRGVVASNGTLHDAALEAVQAIGA